MLESRLAPATISFDAASGALLIHGGPAGAAVQVAMLGNGDVALTLNGQVYSSDPAAPSFDSALGGLSEATLQQISLTGARPTP